MPSNPLRDRDINVNMMKLVLSGNSLSEFSGPVEGRRRQETILKLHLGGWRPCSRRTRESEAREARGEERKISGRRDIIQVKGLEAQ